MAQKYGDKHHVLFDTYHEPQQVDWPGVTRPYHEQVVPVVDVIESLLDANIVLYLRFAGLEVQAAVDALETFLELPSTSMNLRPSEWLPPEVQSLVPDATRRAPGRIVFELTEYTQDLHFVRLFRQAGAHSRSARRGRCCQCCGACRRRA